MVHNLYNDIQARTNGEFYIGVVGPVRTGKSTFIKRFMDVCVLGNMESEYEKKQAMDELPQSGTGKTITTTEPKFIPSEAARIQIDDKTEIKIRLIDCVGYMVDGALGHLEGETMRMVKTPWNEKEIPFVDAARIGTKKVITDHSTIGIVVTSDGSFTDIPRENFEPALDETVLQLKELAKPFVILYNTNKPFAEETKEESMRLEEKYGSPVMPVNCAQLKKEDIHSIMERILFEFPIRRIAFHMPSWVSMLGKEHPMMQSILTTIREKMENVTHMRDFHEESLSFDNTYIERMLVEKVNMADGTVSISLCVNERCYYEMLSDLLGERMEDEYALYSYLKDASKRKAEYEMVRSAMESVRQKGYGVVTPCKEEISLQKPEVIHHGNKYGVKIIAQCPSIHMIRANIETEIAPIVGTKEQAEDLISYINSNHEKDDGLRGEKEMDAGIWNTNIFGKTVEQLVKDGISAKLTMIGEESQMKLQESMQKIVNDTNGSFVCIIL